MKLNDKCSCGSGKKFKKCCKNKKPRKMDYIFNFEDSISFDEYGFYKGIMPLHNGFPATLKGKYVSLNYNGNNREVKIMKMPVKNIIHGYDPCFNFQYFDYIIGVDTNTKRVSNVQLHANAVLIFQPKVNKTNINISLIDVIHDIEIDEIKKPENYFYSKAIDKLLKKYGRNAKILLVIDSDYDKLENFNDRVIPIFENKYLPINFSLSYATADKTDTLLNKIIKATDEYSNDLLKNMLSALN